MILGRTTGAATAKAALFLIVLLLAGCDYRPGAWSSIVYPDKTDRTKFQITRHFSMLSYCLENAREAMNALQVSKGGDYECGRDCDESGDPHKANICAETHK